MRKISLSGVLVCYICSHNVRKSNAKRHGRTIHKVDGVELKNFTKACERETWRRKRIARDVKTVVDISQSTSAAPPQQATDASSSESGSDIDDPLHQNDELGVAGSNTGTAADVSDGRRMEKVAGAPPMSEEASETAVSTASGTASGRNVAETLTGLDSIEGQIGTDDETRGAFRSRFDALSDQLRDLASDFAALSRSVNETGPKQVDDVKKSVDDLRAVIKSALSNARPESGTEEEEPDSATDRNEFEWLVAEPTDRGDMARCSTCTKFGFRGGGKKAEMWISSPVCLGRHRRQRLITHQNSERHRRATDLQRMTKNVKTIEEATSTMRTKARDMTAKNMTVVYNGVLRGHSYADHSHQHLLLDTLGCDIGNQHQTGQAAAQTVDKIYDTFRGEVSRHLKTPNPVTGRPRHIHLTMDKFTEGGNQRQAVNLRTLDSDGSPVVVHGTTGVIRNHGDPVPEYTATLGPEDKRKQTDMKRTVVG